MTDNGYLYILLNPSMPDLVKIGKTTRSPEERAKELSATTGVPSSFIVVYYSEFENCSDAEKYVHDFLEALGYRLSKNREFFEIPVKDAIDSIIKARERFGDFTLSKTQHIEADNNIEKSQPWKDLFEIAETHHHGNDDTIVDHEEAIRYYEKAIKLGSSKAIERIGDIYYSGKDNVPQNWKTALKYYKEAAKNGEVNSYAKAASLYLHERNQSNAFKLYKKFFNLLNWEAANNDEVLQYISSYLIDLSREREIYSEVHNEEIVNGEELPEYYNTIFKVEEILKLKRELVQYTDKRFHYSIKDEIATILPELFD